LVPFLTLLLWAAAAVADETDALDRALRDLSATHGERYHGGREFRQRLEELKPRLSAAPAGERESARVDLERLTREALLANPLLCAHPILFVVRQQYRPDHHNTATFFPAAPNEYNDGQFTPGGALKTIDFAQGGAVRTLLESRHGVIRDPEVHFAGRRIVFAMRANAADSYHLYEIHRDGSHLRQLTRARDVDDLDPLYLPDERIGFSSTREPKYCACNRHIMANLFRMEADGANIHQIGKSTLFEGHASLMPDGRILYDRWEYVDRNFGDAQALWTCNPDGTAHAVYWGNNTASPGAVLDARIIPGTDTALCIFSSCHDRPWGALAIVDRRLGLDGAEGVVRLWPAEATNLIQQSGWEVFDKFTALRLKYEDPFPLSDKYFLASRMTGSGEQMGIYLLDVFGHELLLHAEAPGCFDPMPLAPHPRPPAIPPRRDFAPQPGYCYVLDVYQGTHLAGVKRGAVKWLRVVESPEKRFWTRPAWGGQGQEAPAMNWHDFGNKRILGTVPVEPDGSAYFELPADRFVFFQLVDEDGLMVQSMRSGTIVQSGERTGCIGCHAQRHTAPALTSAPQALQRPPSKLAGWLGPPREFSYLAEVQPVFNKHCLSCHDFGQQAAAVVNLAGDRDLVFNVSYNELWRKKLIRVVGAGPPDTQPAGSWGARASKLGQTLLRNWKTKLTREEFERVVTWLDLNAPYYPSFASAYPDNLAGRSPLDDRQLARLETLTGVPLRRLAGHADNRGPQVCFDRPELSPCLSALTDPADPKRQEALALIRAGADNLRRRPEADSDGFRPCSLDDWRQQRYQARHALEDANREAIRAGRRLLDAP
jgi:hypothetical protein